MMDRSDRSSLALVATPVFVLEPGPMDSPIYSFVNESWERSVGRSSETVLGRDASTVFEGPAGAEILAYQRQAFASGEPMAYDVTVPIGTDTHRVFTTLNPIRDGSGRVVEIVGTKIDHGEIARARDQRAAARELASEVESFISLAAHDLRAPMRQVRILTEMLREDYVDIDPGQALILEKLTGVATKSSEMISDILSHAQAVTAQGDATEFRLGSLIADILLVLDPMRRHGVVSPDLRVRTDRTVLQVALRNLFDNAFKHCRRDSVTLSVDVDDAGGGMLALNVSDSGDGFPDPALAFLDGGVLRPDSGFGLAGIRRLIRGRGGDITAGNTRDGGAQIRFTLPGRLVSARDRHLLAS